MFRPRFLWKLYAGYVALILLTTAVVCIVVTQRLGDEVLQETHRELHAEAILLRDIAMSALAADTDRQLATRLQLLGAATGARLTVIRADGTVLADSAENATKMDNQSNRPEIVASRTQGTGTATRFSQSLSMPVMYWALPVHRNRDLLGYVRTAMPRQVIDARLTRLRAIVFLGAGVAAVVGLLVGFFFARRVTQPLTSMTAVAALLMGENYDQHLRMHSKDEFGEIADAFNRLAANLRERMDTISKEHNQLLAILGSMVKDVIAVDNDERVVHMNQAAGTILRACAEACIGKHLWEVTRVRTIVETVSSTIRDAQEHVHEAHIVESPGELTVQMHAAPLRDSKGEPSGAVVVLHDVTELRRLENIRRDFVANVSHELKTPITTIKGFIETLRDGAWKEREQAERFLAIIARHADRLHAIIEDLLSLSRLDQGADPAALPRTEEVLADVLQAAIQDCAAKAAAAEITLTAACDPSLRVSINAALVEQALANLLDNAINYSKAGGTVWLEAQADTDAITITVRDQGIGIPQEHLPRLFERFYRADKARSRDHGGTGLGLAIVKHIAQVHGGHVAVRSTVGEGSTFTVVLPCPSA